MPSAKYLVAVTVAAALVIAATLWVYPSSTDFAAANPYWQGTRWSRTRLGIQSLRAPAYLPAEAKGTALIVIPAVAPKASDLDSFTRYLAAGGVLVVMDDFGYGNTILAHAGTAARFRGDLLADLLFNVRNPRFPRIIDFAPGPTAAGIREVVLNRATVLDGTAALTVLARSSPLSYLDLNANGRRDADEPGGPFPVAAATPVGAGTLVLVSDPSLLVNSMLDRGQNRLFLQYLFRFAGTDARVYLDEAHLPRALLDRTKDVLERGRALFSHPLLAYALAAAGFALPLAILLKSSGGRS